MMGQSHTGTSLNWGFGGWEKIVKLGLEKSFILLSSMDENQGESFKTNLKKLVDHFLRANNTQNFAKSKNDQMSKAFTLGNWLKQSRENNCFSALHLFVLIVGTGVTN